MFVVASIAVAACTPLMVKWAQNRYAGRRRSAKGAPKPKKKSVTLKDIWDIEDVREGVITLTGGRYRAVLRVSSVNYHLLSQGEQHAVEGALMQMAMSFSFPVQFLVTTEMADARHCISGIRGRLPEMNEKMRQYAADLAGCLEAVTRDRSVYVRRAYAVVGYDTSEGFGSARGELMRRAGTVMEGLARARVAAELLDTEGIIDLLHRVFNRGRTVKPSELVASGGLSLYSNGRGYEVGSAQAKPAEDAGDGDQRAASA